MKREVVLIRNIAEDVQELGNMYVYDENGKELFSCKTLELAWRDNQRNISCVPNGRYPIYLEYSPRFNRMLWELKEVPGRSECKIHAANYFYQLNGCIAPGDMHTKIDGDKYTDVRNSRKTLDRFMEAMQPAEASFITIISI